jgi:pyruvate dehydrogenase (quinone)
MAPALPYAIAAKIAFPERQSIAFVGDGGFSMLMADFLTAVKYELPIVVVIIKNNTLGQIKWEQIVFLGNPEYGVELTNPDFAKYAEICGGIASPLRNLKKSDRQFNRLWPLESAPSLKSLSIRSNHRCRRR